MPKLPDNERERIQALDRLAILNTPPEVDFNDLAWLAAYTCGARFAQINFVHTNRVWTKANIGFPETEVRRAVSPCSIVVSTGDVVIITDTYDDPRVNLSPLVVQGPKIRFYAGAPIKTQDGETIGTLCVMDDRPRDLTPPQQTALWSLARQAATCLGLRRRQEPAQKRAVSEDDTERRVHEYTKRVRSLVEQMPAALWSTDEGLRMTMTLGGALDDMHLRASEVVGKTLFDVFGTEDPEFAPIAAHLKALTGAVPGPLRWTGWGRTLEVRIVPLRADDGTVNGTLGIGIDVTERVKAGRAMERFEDTFKAMVEAASRAVPIDGHGVEDLEAQLHTDIEHVVGSDALAANPELAALLESVHRQSA